LLSTVTPNSTFLQQYKYVVKDEVKEDDILYLVKTTHREERDKLMEMKEIEVLLDGWGMYVVRANKRKAQEEIMVLLKGKIIQEKEIVLVKQMYNAEKKVKNDTADYEVKSIQSVPEIVAQINEQRWFDTVRQLATYNRYTLGSGNANAQQWIISQLSELAQRNSKFTYTTQSFPVQGGLGYNIIATLTGSVTPDVWVIIGGHYDSTSQSPSSSAPGAEDNGSGAAGVLEIARAFIGFDSPSTAIFIFFSGEEQGLYGSEYHSQRLVDEGHKNKLKLMHNMDMIAYRASSNPYYQVLLETFPAYENLFDTYTNNANRFTELDLLYSLNAFGSDHEPYLDLGMPALLTIDGDWDSYPHYHRTTDTIDKLNSRLGFEILKLGAATVATVVGFSA